MANPSGAKLEKIQAMLNKASKPKPFLEANGIWSDDVSKALSNFQVQAKLRASGIVDAETAVVILRYMKTGKIQKEQPVLFFELAGKTYGFTQKEYDRAKKKLINKLLNGIILGLTNKASQAKQKQFGRPMQRQMRNNGL